MGRASTGKRKARETGQTRDHTVPQMYLRQFAEHRSRKHYELTVRPIGSVDEPFPAMPNKVFAIHGYYRGTTVDGVPHHAVEELFTQLEGAAATVMKAVLEDPDGALPGRWPPTPKSVCTWPGGWPPRSCAPRDSASAWSTPAETPNVWTCPVKSRRSRRTTHTPVTSSSTWPPSP